MMKTITLELDNFIDPAVGAAVSYHEIRWNAGRQPFLIPSGGAVHHHSMPEAGSAEHSHEFGEIVFILSGNVVHQVNGEAILMQSNSLVFVRPNDVHGFRPGPEKEPCELLLLSFDLDFFITVSAYLENDAFLQEYTAGVLPSCFTVSEREMNELSLMLLELNSEGMTPILQKIRFKVILLNLFTNFFLHRLSTGAVAPVWFEQLCEKMRKPENFIAGLKRMQKLSGYTPEHLCKVFRKCRRQSPTEFINELRINHAAKLLAETDRGVGEIALDLNFQSLSRFYHLFQKHYSCTPVEYRRRARAIRRIL